jgi:hypothetical protein
VRLILAHYGITIAALNSWEAEQCANGSSLGRLGLGGSSLG